MKKQRIAFGDFQTPPELAESVCRSLSAAFPAPASIIEPTCGVGHLLQAAVQAFPQAINVLGVDINQGYLEQARQKVVRYSGEKNIRLISCDFFHFEWKQIIDPMESPLLIVGNPPWVTNTSLSKLNIPNTPVKSNEQAFSGYDAMTGKSNFDISEWMLERWLDWLNGRQAVLAMLCKTSVARKTLAYAWKHKIQLDSCRIYEINAKKHFNTVVEACLVVCHLLPDHYSLVCPIYQDLDELQPTREIGYREGSVIADMGNYERWRSLVGSERYRWRSGVKHDCADVMELAATGRDGSYRNGLLEHVAMEAIYIYPLVKSSDLANGRLQKPSKHLLVTQKRVGEATHPIQKIAPKTWDYLMKHADLLGGRRSAVYASQPRFAIFGVGEYTFAQWKVAVSGLHKSLQFHVVPPFENKPTLLDDTCYFIACASEEEARFLALLLNSEIASAFYSAFMFPDAKRPVTAEMLRRLDLLSLARELGKEEEYRIYQPSILIQDDNPGHQLSLALPGVSEPDNKRLF